MSNINLKHCVIITLYSGSSLWNHTRAADLQSYDLNHFFFAEWEGGEGVKGQLSQKPRTILLGESPWDFPLKPRHRGQVSQVCPAAALGLEYICVFIGWCGTTIATKPQPFPQSMVHLMLMFKWAYWVSFTLYSMCSNAGLWLWCTRIMTLSFVDVYTAFDNLST